MTGEFIEKLIDKNHDMLTAVGAQNINSENQGLKKFLYKIKRFDSGFYIFTTFNLSEQDMPKLAAVEKNLNFNLDIIRYILINQTEYLHQKSKEVLNAKPEYTDHRQLNKGRIVNKKCIFTYLGRRVVDYKETDFLRQFMSPYAKIFGRDRTGLSAKAQRKVTRAIKRARHMALLPFVGE